MKLELIAWTPHAEEICAAAARLCYQPGGIETLSQISPKKVQSLLSRIIASGHHSVLEHASFTFALEGVSRAFTHQLVRHRIASYSQQSQRHVKVEEADFVIPPSIRSNPEFLEIFEKAFESSFEAYRKLMESGIPVEDARYVLPQASTSRLVFTMNARELWHFFELRCCEKAQWEIRAIAFLALKKVKEICPNLFRDAGPMCFHDSCKELDFPCWRPGSAFFKEKKELFLKRLKGIFPEIEEIKIPQFSSDPKRVSEFLSCSPEQVLQTLIGEISGEPSVILYSGFKDPFSLDKDFRPWGEEEIKKKTGFSTKAIPLLPFSEKVSFFIEKKVLDQDRLFFNLASPWYYGKIPGVFLMKIEAFAKEVRIK